MNAEAKGNELGPTLKPVTLRPVKVMLFPFNGFGDAADRQHDGWLGLRFFTEWLNEGQELFNFQHTEYETRVTEDLPHGFTAKASFDCLSQQLENLVDISCGIGLTDSPLELGVFNHHDESRGVGVVTFEVYKQYVPETASLERYLAYLVLCEAFCLAGRKQFEHEEHRKCLFDFCGNKLEFTDCLVHPHICTQCKKELVASGFEAHLVESVEKLLFSLAKPWPGSAFNAVMRRPASAMLVGSLVAIVTATYAATEEGFGAWLPSIALGVAVVSLVFLQYIRHRLTRRMPGKPPGKWRRFLQRPRRWLVRQLR